MASKVTREDEVTNLLSEIRHLATSGYADVVYSKATKVTAGVVESEIHKRVDRLKQLAKELVDSGDK